MNFYRVSVQDDEHGMPVLEEEHTTLPDALRLVADLIEDSEVEGNGEVYGLAGGVRVILTPNGLNIGDRTYITVKEVE